MLNHETARSDEWAVLYLKDQNSRCQIGGNLIHLVKMPVDLGQVPFRDKQTSKSANHICPVEV
jgi:hypothetical protein